MIKIFYALLYAITQIDAIDLKNNKVDVHLQENTESFTVTLVIQV